MNNPNLMEEVVKTDSWGTFGMILSESGSEHHGVGAQSSSGFSKNWACKHCTFTNNHPDTCEMCGLPKDS